MKSIFKSTLGHHSLAFAGTLFAASLVAVSIANPNAWIKTGFESAINGNTGSTQMAATHRMGAVPIAGSEAFWLSAHQRGLQTDLMQPATWQPPVAKGDRFTITAGDKQREYEVTQIEPVAVPVSDTGAHASARSKTQFLIVCRTTDRADGETLKFLIDANAALPWSQPLTQAAHAL